MRYVQFTGLALFLSSIPAIGDAADSGSRGDKDLWDILQALGPIIGFVALIAAAFVVYGLNRRQRRWEIGKERRALAAALAGEMQHLLSDVKQIVSNESKMESAIEALGRSDREVAISEFFVESAEFNYTVVFDGNVGKLGHLGSRLSEPVARFYAGYKSLMDNIKDAGAKKYHDDRGGCALALERALGVAKTLAQSESTLKTLEDLASGKEPSVS